MFLSRFLTKKELKYGPSELKVAYLVQVVKRLYTIVYLLKHPVIVLTNYLLIKGIIK